MNTGKLPGDGTGQMGETNPQDDQDEGQEGGGGICIEIQCLPDGTFNVSSEPLQEEAQEEQGEGAEDEGSGQTVNSFGDALKAAIALYRENAPSDSTAQQQFQSGFSKGGM